MPGVDGVGLVEDLFVDRAVRGQGIAQALIAHATADARARGAGAGDHRLADRRLAQGALRPHGIPTVFVERSWDLDRPDPSTSRGLLRGPAGRSSM